MYLMHSFQPVANMFNLTCLKIPLGTRIPLSKKFHSFIIEEVSDDYDCFLVREIDQNNSALSNSLRHQVPFP